MTVTLYNQARNLNFGTPNMHDTDSVFTPTPALSALPPCFRISVMQVEITIRGFARGGFGRGACGLQDLPESAKIALLVTTVKVAGAR